MKKNKIRLNLISKYSEMNDETNGAFTRLNSWIKVIEDINISKNKNDNIKIPQDKNIRSYFCLDLTGEKLPEILKLWKIYRSLKPTAFLQDSGTRYWISYFKYNIKISIKLNLKIIINILRSLLREIVVRILFRKVGYISNIDSNYLIKGGYCVGITKPLIDSWNSIVDLNKNSSITNIALYGNFEYKPNLDSICRILNNEKFIEVIRENNINLIIKGKSSVKIYCHLNNKIISHVNQKDSGEFENIQEVMISADIIILPTMYGSGIKNRAIESSNAQKPYFIWDGFKNEYPYDQTFSMFYKNESDLADKIKMLLDYQKDFGPQPSYKWKSQLELLNLFY